MTDFGCIASSRVYSPLPFVNHKTSRPVNNCRGAGSGVVETKDIPKWNQAGIRSIQILESATEGGLTLHSGQGGWRWREKRPGGREFNGPE